MQTSLLLPMQCSAIKKQNAAEILLPAPFITCWPSKLHTKPMCFSPAKPSLIFLAHISPETCRGGGREQEEGTEKTERRKSEEKENKLSGKEKAMKIAYGDADDKDIFQVYG